MFKTAKIEKLVELALLTGFIKDDVPVSLILIAKPESAKTSILVGFECIKTVETSDLSPKEITEKIVPQLRENQIHHIIIPDLVKVLAHKPTTADGTIAFLNAMMEEGIKKQMFFGQSFELPERKYCGLITSITLDYFYKMFRKWNDIGFTTRFIPVSYKYSFETIAEIHKLIQQNTFFKEIKTLGVRKMYSIKIPDDIASFISLKAQEIAKNESNFIVRIRTQGGKTKKVPTQIMGFRLQRQLRQLARAIALMRNKKELTVNWKDTEELKGLLDYIRMPHNPKEI